MRSASQHSFAIAPSVDIPRSSFKRNFTYKTTFNASYLIPCIVEEVLPGDSINLKLTAFTRMLSPLNQPIIDNLYLDFQFFYIPTRLVWDDYEKFFGASKGPSDHWEYDDSTLVPQVEAPSGGFASGSVADYFGLPIGVDNIKVNALPFRCYNKVIADWYRPSSYGFGVPVLTTTSSDDSNSIFPLRQRLKRADYFTAALPDTQRGNGIELPLGTSAPVIPYTAESVPYFKRRDNVALLADSLISDGGLVQYQSSNDPDGDSSWRNFIWKNGMSGSGIPYTGLKTDLSSATAVTVNDLRQAFQLQRALERDMRSGVTYRDVLQAHFGVRSPDARLQRSEYLGGGTMPIHIHTVANTTGTSDAAQGKLTAYAQGGDQVVGFVKSFVEHGYILGMVSARADVTYQQGIPRMFSRRSRFDFYFPVFATLGEQAILEKEIYATGTSSDDDVFGYQERFAEYRYSVNKITGQLRSQYPQPLDSWHLAQKFNNPPTLNGTFLQENVPMSRIKAVTTAPDFLLDMLVAMNHVRPMPTFGVPGLVDHF